MHDRTRLTVVVLAAAVAVTGLWIGPRLVAATQEGVESQQGASTTPSTQTVLVERPVKTTVARALDVPATIEAFEAAEIHARISGYVAAVHVDIGAFVNAGAPLCELEVPEVEQERLEAQAKLAAKRAELAAAEGGASAAARAGVDQAQQQLEVARSEARRKRVDAVLAQQVFERREQLFADQAVTTEALEDASSALEAARGEEAVAAARIAAAEADLAYARAAIEVVNGAIESARAQVAIAVATLGRVEARLTYATISAPFDGFVTRRDVDRGELVRPPTSAQAVPLFVVQQLDRVRVTFAVPEVDQPFVTAGTKVSVRPYAAAGEAMAGEVARIASALDPATRSMRAEIDLPNPGHTLLHGMYAQITVEIDPHPDALTVPATALLTDGQGTYLYVARDGRAVRVAVTTGIDDGARVEIREGLVESDRVIVTGQGNLSPGTPVAEAERPK